MELDSTVMLILQTENNISTVKEKATSATDCSYIIKLLKLPMLRPTRYQGPFEVPDSCSKGLDSCFQ